MSVYFVVNVDVQDPSAYEPYKAAVPSLIHKHGGEYLVRGGEVEVIEGDWRPKRMAVLKFPSREAAYAFLGDPEYAPFKSLRQRIAPTEMILVDGV